MKSVTLSDIAKKTGYSINTVSHALLDKPDISEKTKEYIRATANEMGYIANTAAGALRSGKSKSVAIIVGDISNPHFAIMIKEMEARLRKYGYNAFILNTDEDEKTERSAIISAISKNVDGIIMCPVQKSQANIEFLNKNGVKYVLFGRRFEKSKSSYVICNDYNSGYLAAEHLISLGHRELLFINGPSYVSSARERLEGALAAAEKSGLESGAVKNMELRLNETNTAVQAVLESNPSRSGIICFSDIIALKVCFILKKMGKTVPDDFSVIGFDNIASRFFLPLMLTSATSSKTKMSVKAVDALMDIINNPTAEPLSFVLPTKLIRRETTAKKHN